MTIALPLVALVVLLVVWAKCCPEITNKRVATVTYYFPRARVAAIVNEFGKLTVTFQAVAEASDEAARSVTLFGKVYRPDES